jgi:type II secretory pathway component PulK
MKLNRPFHPVNEARAATRGSVLVIVIWIVFGLVAMTLYFGHSMSMELRAEDNRAAAMESSQAIEGAARYISCVLSNLTTPGVMPDLAVYQNEAVPVGNAHYWLIGRNWSSSDPPTTPHFGLIDEASKLNLNFTGSNALSMIPRMQPDVLANILAWRSTNTSSASGGAESDTYMRNQPPYLCKNAPFETVDELRLIYNMDIDSLYGEDANLNGILDANENDGDTAPPSDNRDGILDPGILEYVTVYTHEPTKMTNGTTARYNIATFTSLTDNQKLISALTNGTGIAYSRASTIVNQATQGARPGTTPFTSPLQFYLLSKMTVTEIAQAEYTIRGLNVQGLVNVNTASQAVLACIPGLTNGQAATLVSYRQQNTNNLNGSIGWVTQSGLQTSDLTLAGPYLTGKTYQYMADIAAIGHDGRGYRRMRFVFDLAQGGAPIIRYRQDLTHLGWALGKDVRDKWVMAKGLP